MALPCSLALALIAASVIMGLGGAISTSIDVENGCSFPIYVGISTSGSAMPVDIAELKLGPGAVGTVQVPAGTTSGRVWGHIDSTSGASGQEDAGGGVLPVTLVQFRTAPAGSGGIDDVDVYAISLLDGYNLPITVQPKGDGGCEAVSCTLEPTDCPPELLVPSPPAAGSTNAFLCNSACTAFKDPRFCCSGDYGSPNKCLPSPYSVALNKACPHAITYPLDADTVFSCRTTGYSVAFCKVTTTITSGSSTPANDSTASEISKINLVVAAVGLVTAIISLVGVIVGVLKCCCN